MSYRSPIAHARCGFTSDSTSRRRLDDLSHDRTQDRTSDIGKLLADRSSLESEAYDVTTEPTFLLGLEKQISCIHRAHFLQSKMHLHKYFTKTYKNRKTHSTRGFQKGLLIECNIKVTVLLLRELMLIDGHYSYQIRSELGQSEQLQ